MLRLMPENKRTKTLVPSEVTHYVHLGKSAIWKDYIRLVAFFPRNICL